MNPGFGETTSVTVPLVAGQSYRILLEHVQSNLEEPDLDYVLSVEPDSSDSTPVMVLDPDGLSGLHYNVSDYWLAEKRLVVSLPRARILADRDRDGDIDESDDVSGPLRMWINDDCDAGTVAEGNSDVPCGARARAANCNDDVVNGMSDLEDFFPVWLDISDALVAIDGEYAYGRVVLQLETDGAPVNFVESDLSRNQAGNYLRDVPTAQSHANLRVNRLPRQGGRLPEYEASVLMMHPERGVLLLEGNGTGEDDLVLDILVNGEVKLRVPMEISVGPVEDFYRWVNLRGAVGGSEVRPTDLSEPANFPDSESNGKNVVFVHGFNVTETGARGWNAEMFKRLWQNGCNAKYYAVTWRGDLSWWVFRGLFYHEDVVNAFLTAGEFNTVFSGMEDDTAVLAHSLGNMVVCSAIQDWFYRPSVYCMLNAAVPAEAVDTNAWSDVETGNPMVHHAWKDYANRTWAAKWHELFPAGDDRHKLTWKGRFASLPTISGLSLYNFYSSGDEELGLRDVVGADGMVEVDYDTGEEKRNHSWQKQERFKGRKHFDFPEEYAATDQAGWGFKCHMVNMPFTSSVDWVRDTYLSAAAANAATANQLKTTPVFENNPSSLFSSTIPKTTRDALLAQAIPALSPPVGVVSCLEQESHKVNENLFSERGSTESTWPRSPVSMYGQSFLHSDIKNVALPLVKKIWTKLTACTND